MGMIQAPMLAAASGNDVDFMVHGLIPLNFFGHKVWITTTHVTTLIVMLFIMALALIARRSIMKDYEKPSGLANAVELVVEMLDKLVKRAPWENTGSRLPTISEASCFSSLLPTHRGFLGSGRRRPIMGLLCLWH